MRTKKDTALLRVFYDKKKGGNLGKTIPVQEIGPEFPGQYKEMVFLINGLLDHHIDNKDSFAHDSEDNVSLGEILPSQIFTNSQL